jgi:hypothetical protein
MYSLRVLPKYDEPNAGWDASNDYEPNDVWQLANEIGVGYAQVTTRQIYAPDSTNYVTNAYDVDWYRLTTSANRTYVIETINVQQKYGVSPSVGTGLWLYGTDGTTLATHDGYGNNGTGNTDARIVYTFPQAGTYYIRVASSWSDSSWSGMYSLRVLPKYDEPNAGWDASNDYEPNDEWQLANEIGVGLNQAQTHQIYTRGSTYVTNSSDYDWYRFISTAGTRCVVETFSVAKQNNIGTGVWLYGIANNTATLLANDQYGNNGGGNVDARITYTIPTSGIYFVRVGPEAGSSWTGAYSIRVCQNSCITVFLPLIMR